MRPKPSYENFDRNLSGGRGKNGVDKSETGEAGRAEVVRDVKGQDAG